MLPNYVVARTVSSDESKSLILKAGMFLVFKLYCTQKMSRVSVQYSDDWWNIW